MLGDYSIDWDGDSRRGGLDRQNRVHGPIVSVSCAQSMHIHLTSLGDLCFPVVSHCDRKVRLGSCSGSRLVARSPTTPRLSLRSYTCSRTTSRKEDRGIRAGYDKTGYPAVQVRERKVKGDFLP